MHRYFIIYKPYGMLSQFKKDGKWRLLGELFDFPEDVYPVGRLDVDSEGLLILTNDKSLNDRLLNPKFEHKRTYWVQVDDDVKEDALNKLESGLIISIEGKPHHCRNAIAKKIERPEMIGPRNPPVRYRKYIPTSWLSITLTEGKNRQVRRMTAAVGHPTIRLIRYSIEGLELPEYKPEGVWEWSKEKLFEKLFK